MESIANFESCYLEKELSDTDLKQLVLRLAKTLEQIELKVSDQESKSTTLTIEITDLKERASSQKLFNLLHFPCSCSIEGSGPGNVQGFEIILQLLAVDGGSERLSSLTKTTEYGFELSNIKNFHLILGQKRNLCQQKIAWWVPK